LTNVFRARAEIVQYPVRGSSVVGPKGGVVAVKASGTVKWFNEAKGYGFIAQDSGEDIFVHYSAIKGEGFRTLNEGDKVEFEVQQGDKGKHAANVEKAQM